MRTLPVLLAAAALAVAGPAFPAPVQPPRSSAADAAVLAKAQRWLNELAAWSLPLNPILMENVAAMSHLMEGAATAAAYYDKGDFAGGKAWAGAWTREANARLERLDALRGRLPGPPPPIPDGLDGMEAVTAGLDRAPDAIRSLDALLAGSVAGGRRYVTMIAETAAGSEGARTALPGLGLDAAMTLIRGENSFLEFSKLTTMPGHPQYDLVDTSLHSNLAALALMEFRRAKVYGEAPDNKAYAARIRREADASLAATRSLRSNTRTAQALMKADPAGSTPLGLVIQRAAETYHESAEVEEAIAAALHRIADSVEKDESLDEGPAKAAGEALQELTLKRAAIDTRRREIIAGKP